MLNSLPHSTTSNILDRPKLVKLRLKAMRAGVWFKALPRIDRALIDLTIKVACSIRSTTLAKNLHAVIKKLEGAMESRLSRALREVGLPLAQKLSLTAQKWGNNSARSWASASSFATFLAAMHINDPKTFRLQFTIAHKSMRFYAR